MTIERVGQYRILRLLGRGASGSVFEALEPGTERRVALKLLDGEQHCRDWARALREIGDAAHPNLVKITHIFSEPAAPHYIMPLINGPDLVGYVRQHAQPHQRKPAKDDSAMLLLGTQVNERGESDFSSCGSRGFTRARATLIDVSRGLSRMHELGWVHCDVRPDNIRVQEGRAVVLDLGMARRLGSRGDPAAPVGTVAYMAPEQWRADSITPATDWYALGVTLFEILTGALPFTGTAGEVFLRKRSVGAPAPSFFVDGVPTDLDQLCVDLMRSNPEGRPDAGQIEARLS